MVAKERYWSEWMPDDHGKAKTHRTHGKVQSLEEDVPVAFGCLGKAEQTIFGGHLEK